MFAEACGTLSAQAVGRQRKPFHHDPRIVLVAAETKRHGHADGACRRDLGEPLDFGFEHRSSCGAVELDEELAPAAANVMTAIDAATADGCDVLEVERACDGAFDGVGYAGPGEVRHRLVSFYSFPCERGKAGMGAECSLFSPKRLLARCNDSIAPSPTRPNPPPLRKGGSKQRRTACSYAAYYFDNACRAAATAARTWSGALPPT